MYLNIPNEITNQNKENKTITTEQVNILAISLNYTILKQIKNPSYNEQYAFIVYKNHLLIDDMFNNKINYFHEDNKLKIIKDNCYNIKHFFIQNEQLQLEAIKQEVSSIKYINNIKLHKYVIELNAENIKHINNPSEEIQLLAISKDPTIIDFYNNLTEKMIDKILDIDIENYKLIKNLDETTIYYIISKYPECLKFIENQNYDMQILAISKNRNCFKYLKNISQETLSIFLHLFCE
jgi:hypothetical protein